MNKAWQTADLTSILTCLKNYTKPFLDSKFKSRYLLHWGLMVGQSFLIAGLVYEEFRDVYQYFTGESIGKNKDMMTAEVRHSVVADSQ